jgi:hypothetical protein
MWNGPEMRDRPDGVPENDSLSISFAFPFRLDAVAASRLLLSAFYTSFPTSFCDVIPTTSTVVWDEKVANILRQPVLVLFLGPFSFGAGTFFAVRSGDEGVGGGPCSDSGLKESCSSMAAIWSRRIPTRANSREALGRSADWDWQGRTDDQEG